MNQALVDSEEIERRAEERLGLELSEKWTLQRVLGIGGMAAVYAAQHRNQSRVAIKMLHAHFSSDRVIRQRFLKEGYAGNSIDHRGVVRVLDDGVADDGAAFVVMELLEGMSLEQLVARHGPISPAHALDFAIQACEVLAAAHHRGVVHRDIKPDNFFITLDGEVKLLDFGIARVTEHGHSTTVGSFMGTPAYASPEQAKGKWEEVDARSDVWSLGATLFTALTDQQVHQADTTMEQLALAVHAPPRRLEETGFEFSKDLCEVVNQSLSVNKDERFASASVMLSALLQVEETLAQPEKHLGELCYGAAQVSSDSATVVAPSHTRRTGMSADGTLGPSGGRRRRSSRSDRRSRAARQGLSTAAAGTPQAALHGPSGSSQPALRQNRVIWIGATLLVLAAAGVGMAVGAGVSGQEEAENEASEEAGSSESAGSSENTDNSKTTDNDASRDAAADEATKQRDQDAAAAEKATQDSGKGPAETGEKSADGVADEAPARRAAPKSPPSPAPRPWVKPKPQAALAAPSPPPAPAPSPPPAPQPTSRENMLKGRF